MVSRTAKTLKMATFQLNFKNEFKSLPARLYLRGGAPYLECFFDESKRFFDASKHFFGTELVTANHAVVSDLTVKIHSAMMAFRAGHVSLVFRFKHLLMFLRKVVGCRTVDPLCRHE